MDSNFKNSKIILFHLKKWRKQYAHTSGWILLVCEVLWRNTFLSELYKITKQCMSRTCTIRYKSTWFFLYNSHQNVLQYESLYTLYTCVFIFIYFWILKTWYFFKSRSVGQEYQKASPITLWVQMTNNDTMFAGAYTNFLQSLHNFAS